MQSALTSHQIVTISCLLFEALIFVTGRRVEAKFAEEHQTTENSEQKGVENENFDDITETVNDKHSDL